MGAAAAGAPLRTHSSTCFIDSAEHYGLGVRILGAAAAGGQFGSKARPPSLWVYCCGSVAIGRLL